MSEIFPSIENHLSDNAGYYSALGAMHHSNNQQRLIKEQKKTQEIQLELFKEQEKANKIENDRLQIEKNRLKIEKHRSELEVLEKEEQKLIASRVKSIRQCMANMNQDLDFIDQSFE